jgi:hypothetical protein
MASTKKPIKKTVSTAAKPALKTAKVAAKPRSAQSIPYKDIVKIEVVAFTILAAIFLVLAIIKYT